MMQKCYIIYLRVLYKPKMRLIYDFSSKIAKLGQFSTCKMIPWSKMKKMGRMVCADAGYM